MNSNILAFQSQTENQYYLSSPNNHKVYLYLQVKGKQHEAAQKRLPLNLSLVIDKSGSMKGDKLENVKKAMEFVIQQLLPEDRLSLVAYDAEVSLLSASSLLRDKTRLLKIVRNLQSGSTTNLSGGMLEGFAQVAAADQSGTVNRVLLLSDGLANRGVTDPTKLQHMAQNKFRIEGAALSTFGVGADYNEDLMTNLAEYGGGNYYFIESADKIPEMFATELQGLLTVIAQRAQIALRFPAEHLSLSRVLGYPHRLDGNEVVIDFNDIFSGEEKAVVLEFELKGAPQKPLSFTGELRYEDVIEKFGSVREPIALAVQPTSDPEMYRRGLQATALSNIAQFVGNDLLSRAIVAMDQAQRSLAKNLLTELRTYLEGVLRVVPASQPLRDLLQMGKSYEDQMSSMDQMPAEERQMTQKRFKSRSYLYSKRRG